MVTGMYVGLEGPSWTGAMMALANTVADKVEFCEEYGIAITQEQWPCRHLPETILADRGEMEGTAVETLIHALKVNVENAAPYRPDWKGAVERFFRTIHDRVRPEAPGFILPDYRKRGERDYRLDATMTLKDFTQLVIGIVLLHNEEVLSSYECDAQMVADGVIPAPVELWNWGLKKRSGSLHVIPDDIVRLHLLPTSKASITPKGIQFSLDQLRQLEATAPAQEEDILKKVLEHLFAMGINQEIAQQAVENTFKEMDGQANLADALRRATILALHPNGMEEQRKSIRKNRVRKVPEQLEIQIKKENEQASVGYESLRLDGLIKDPLKDFNL